MYLQCRDQLHSLLNSSTFCAQVWMLLFVSVCSFFPTFLPNVWKVFLPQFGIYWHFSQLLPKLLESFYSGRRTICSKNRGFHRIWIHGRALPTCSLECYYPTWHASGRFNCCFPTLYFFLCQSQAVLWRNLCFFAYVLNHTKPWNTCHWMKCNIMPSKGQCHLWHWNSKRSSDMI